MEEVITEPYVTIKMDQASLSLMSDWMGSPTTEQFKEGKSKMLNVLIDHSLSVMVLNYHHMVAYLNLEAQIWAINEWFPKVIQENIKHIGIVIPSKVMAQIVVKSIYTGLSNTAVSHGIEISYFDNVQQLQSWVSKLQRIAGSGLNTPLKGGSYQTSLSQKEAAQLADHKYTSGQKTKVPSSSGVDLGLNKQPPSPDYGKMDDEIHDDPFA